MKRGREGKGREKEREEGRETLILLFHLPVHSLVVFCMFPDQEATI